MHIDRRYNRCCLDEKCILSKRSVSLSTVESYRKTCKICLVENIGFPTLCNQGDSVEHTFCLECVLILCLQKGSLSAPCPLCRSLFNINDFLISRELHLMQSAPIELAISYAKHMEVNPLLLDEIDHHVHIPLIRYFALATKEDQQQIISKIYWGNNALFKKSTEQKPSTQSIRIKQNLLAIIGNPWSPELNQKQSRKMLLNIFLNGWLICPLYKETQETFLHRCHLFIRKVMPLTNVIGEPYNLLYRVNQYGCFIPEYYSNDIEQSVLRLDRAHARSRSILANRTSTGPLKEELLHPVGYKEERINWNILKRIEQDIFLLQLEKLDRQIFCLFAICQALLHPKYEGITNDYTTNIVKAALFLKHISYRISMHNAYSIEQKKNLYIASTITSIAMSTFMATILLNSIRSKDKDIDLSTLCPAVLVAIFIYRTCN